MWGCGFRLRPNDNNTGVMKRQVPKTPSKQSEVLSPMACMGTIFIDKKVAIAAMVVSAESNTPQPVEPTASTTDARRRPVCTNRVLKKL